MTVQFDKPMPASTKIVKYSDVIYKNRSVPAERTHVPATAIHRRQNVHRERSNSASTLQLISDYRSLYRGRRRWARPRRRARPRRCSGSSAWGWSWHRSRSGLRSRSGSWRRSCCCCCCCCCCRRRRLSNCWSRRGCSSRQLKSIDFVISSNVDTPTSHNASSAVRVRARHQFVGAATGIHNRPSISVITVQPLVARADTIHCPYHPDNHVISAVRGGHKRRAATVPGPVYTPFMDDGWWIACCNA